MTQKYYKYKINNILKISKIITFHFFNFNKSFESFLEKHDFYELVYCKKGSLFVNQNDKKIELKEGEMIIHAPNVMHGIAANGVVSPSLYIISFSCNSKQFTFFDNKQFIVPDRLKNILNLIFEIANDVFDIDNTTPYTKKMPLKSDAAIGGLQSLTNLLEFFFIDLMKNNQLDDVRYLINTNKLVENVISYLKNNIENKIKIDDLTKEFGYSKSLIFKEFKRETNTTIITFFNNLKLEKSKYLLKSSDITINEISSKYGFLDANYYIKAFKKKYGITPLKFRLKFRK